MPPPQEIIQLVQLTTIIQLIQLTQNNTINTVNKLVVVVHSNTCITHLHMSPYLGRFVRWTIRTMDFSYHGVTDYSYYGLFVPFTNITYAKTKANVCVSVCLTVNIV